LLKLKINKRKNNIMSFIVTTKNCWLNKKEIVKIFFLNDIPFTFDDLPVGYFYDKQIVEEANSNQDYSGEDIYKGSNYLIMEKCHPCFDDIEILNPENLPEEIQSFYNGEEDLLR
tara:strand:+ start:1329 stop:1673 length:345 start_codon:yes stop_codon:yes gene_type:complete